MHTLWHDDESQDVAEYTVLLSIVLLLVLMVVTAVGTTAMTLFSKSGGTLKGVIAAE